VKNGGSNWALSVYTENGAARRKCFSFLYPRKRHCNTFIVFSHRVVLETTVNGRGVLLSFDDDGFDTQERKSSTADRFH